MSDLRPVLFIIGFLLCGLAIAMLVPAAVDAAVENPDWSVFLQASSATAFVGGALIIAQRGLTGLVLNLRQAFLLTTLSWLALSAFAALPFLFFSGKLNYADAFFEAISGLTTTGSTILVGLDNMPPGILLWRAILQWLGGIGIIVMAIALLPFLRVGGMQLFRTESSDRSDKALPRAGQIAGGTILVYLGLSILCALGYWIAGMSGFEAIAHAMTTLSTGGYSTSDLSLANFAPAVQWVSVAFMALGGLPFVLYINVIKGRPGQLWWNPQVQTYLRLLVVVILAMTWWLSYARDAPLFDSLRAAAFNVTSIVTTTGYATADYGSWGSFALTVFFLITFVGACTGSTTGGIKIMRFEILALILRRMVRQLINPHAVVPFRYGGRDIGPDVSFSVMVFVFLFMVSFVFLTLALAALGLDFVTSASGAATALANVGPGLGDIIGPAGNFSRLPDAAKWILSFGMLLGRLELFTVLVLFQPRFWGW